jgi:hypothetical protein
MGKFDMNFSRFIIIRAAGKLLEFLNLVIELLLNGVEVIELFLGILGFLGHLLSI